MTRSRASTWLSMRSMQRCTSRCSTCCCLAARCSALYSAVTCISCNISHQRVVISCHHQASHNNPDRHVGNCEPAAASLLGLCSAANYVEFRVLEFKPLHRYRPVVHVPPHQFLCHDAERVAHVTVRWHCSEEMWPLLGLCILCLQTVQVYTCNAYLFVQAVEGNWP